MALSLVKATTPRLSGSSMAVSRFSYTCRPTTLPHFLKASTLSCGQTMIGFAPKANTRDRASRIALTEPSISGTLWGSNTNPTRIYTGSPGWMALHNASAACMAVGSPVYARLPAYKMRHTP